MTDWVPETWVLGFGSTVLMEGAGYGLKQVDFDQAFSGFLPKFLAKNEEEIALLNAHFYFRLIPGTRSITNNIYITHSS